MGEAFRSVASVTTFNGRYEQAKSQIINSPTELERFIAGKDKYDIYGPVNASEPLVAALRAANVDFKQEALVVLQSMSGGGPINIAIDPPQLQGRTFVSTIRTTEFGSGGPAIISYRYFIFAVSRARIDDIRVAVIPAPDTNGTAQTILLTVPDR